MDYCDAKRAVSPRTPYFQYRTANGPFMDRIPSAGEMHQLDTNLAFDGATAGFLGLREC
jgi:hypothetical protein